MCRAIGESLPLSTFHAPGDRRERRVLAAEVGRGARLGGDGRSLTVRVPMAFARRGGRKAVISPDGVSTVMA